MSDSGTHVFTPRKSASSEQRYALEIDDADYVSTHGYRSVDWQAVVTDVLTGARYLVHGAECSLPRCYCDAVAEPIG
jgi:hypothetical protein